MGQLGGIVVKMQIVQNNRDNHPITMELSSQRIRCGKGLK